jgi:hypothetical protein
MGLRYTVTNGVSQVWWGVNTSVFYTYTPPTNAAFRQYLILKNLDNNAPSMLLNFLCEQKFTDNTQTKFTPTQSRNCGNNDITTSAN